MGLLQRRYTNAPPWTIFTSLASMAGWNRTRYSDRGSYDQRRWCETQSTLEPVDKPLSHIRRIQLCESSAAIAECALPHIPSMSVNDVCTVLSVLKKFRGDAQPELTNALAEQIIQQKSTLQPRHIAHIFHTFARLRCPRRDLFEAMAQQTMLPFQVSSHPETRNLGGC